MPSSGKSTIGSNLADILNMNYIDTDNLILESQKKDLRDIVSLYGHHEFLKIQEEVILQLDTVNSIIATGGSVIYGDAAMVHLKKDGVVIYLQLDFNSVNSRIKQGRRFAKNEEQSFIDMYHERVPLYERYSDIVIDCSGKDVKAIVKEIIEKLQKCF
ncbi:MAG TPA: shikimate kinase [Clostridiales bacterium]|nr:shikimate kinase [Clostridiales bacterium]